MALAEVRVSRTPPGVRELKLESLHPKLGNLPGRTPPGVRELKPRALPL